MAGIVTIPVASDDESVDRMPATWEVVGIMQSRYHRAGDENDRRPIYILDRHRQ